MGQRCLGDTARGRDIGKCANELYMWVACDKCGEQRWAIKAVYEKSTTRLCKRCWSRAPKVKSITPEMKAMGIKDIQHGGDSLKVLVNCPKCGVALWRRHPQHYKNPNALCRKCSARDTMRIVTRAKFKGVKSKHCQGYIMIWLPHEHMFRGMAGKNGYVMQHRLVIAESLNRPLLPSEHVHHRNGIKTDNRIENLELVSPADHRIYSELCADCSLRKEIRLLRWELKELRAALQEKMRI